MFMRKHPARVGQKSNALGSSFETSAETRTFRLLTHHPREEANCRRGNRHFRLSTPSTLIEISLTTPISSTYSCHTFGTVLAFAQDATFRMNCEAVMWKITTRGITLEEVLILAAMNLLATTDAAAKREKPAPQKSKEDQAWDRS